MKRQRGSLMIYGALAAGAVILAMGIALKVQSSRLDASKAETERVKAQFAGFVTETKRLGDEAAAKAKAKEKSDKALKEKVDAENKTLKRDLAAESERLRVARSGSSFLPKGTGAADSPTVTADRAKLEAALRDFDTAVARIVDEGDSAVVDLNAGRAWVKERGAVR